MKKDFRLMRRQFKPVIFVPERADAQTDVHEGKDTESSHDIYKRLVNIKSPTPDVPEKSVNDSMYLCADCDKRVPITDKVDHLKSISHQISIRRTDKHPVSYSIPASNIGFKLLRDHGWRDTQSGLGSDEQGPVHPVGGRLKLDRGGFGSTTSKSVSMSISSRELEIESKSSMLKGNEVKKRSKRDIDQEHADDQQYRKRMLQYMHHPAMP